MDLDTNKDSGAVREGGMVGDVGVTGGCRDRG